MKESGWDCVPCECCRAWICEERASQPVCASAHPEAPIPSDQINFEKFQTWRMLGSGLTPISNRSIQINWSSRTRDQNEILRRISEFVNDEEGRLLDRRVEPSRMWPGQVGEEERRDDLFKKNPVKKLIYFSLIFSALNRLYIYSVLWSSLF